MEFIKRGKLFKSGNRAAFRWEKADFAACSFEERNTIIFYLLNMIHTGLVKQFGEEIFNFCIDVLGTKSAYSSLKAEYQSKLDHDDRDDLYGWSARKLRDKDVTHIINDIFVPAIATMLKKSAGGRNRELILRLNNIKHTFRLTNEEMAILELFYFIKTHSTVSAYLAKDPLDLANYHILKLYGNAVLGLDRRAFHAALNSSALFDAKLIEHNDDLSINDKICDYLLGVGDRELKNTFFTNKIATDLSVDDFSLPQKELRVLKALLTSNKSCNILFYGAPGTGKTSLAHCLAKYLGRDLYCVRIDDGKNEYGFRLQALYATLNVAQGRKAIVVVDEADEILNTMYAERSSRSKNSVDKSWINNLLDTHSQKVIWITNQSRKVELSTMRRFAFSLEFEKLTADKRQTIYQHELKKHGMTGYVNQDDLRELSKTYEVDAGGIVNAVTMLKIKRRMKKNNALEMMETVLKNHEKATRGANLIKKKKDFRQYSLRGLHTSEDLERIISAAKAFSVQREHNGPQAVSFLLYGLPGTGKSEFVHYLGNQLAKDVVLKRASDIQDAYVGQTEKNIARAFREAEEDKSILFFDEADSFFYPRKNAAHSWEKSFTNEILAQLDSFSGIVIFATNDKEGLDHAALRRFKYKVEFKPLTPEGNLHMYETLLAPLVRRSVAMTAAERCLLKGIEHLTPGEFAVVRDQHMMKQAGAIGHGDLITALINEVKHKQVAKLIGFSCRFQE